MSLTESGGASLEDVFYPVSVVLVEFSGKEKAR
jgi:hypothetical protein